MDASTLGLLALALILSGLAYLKSPDLPLVGLKTSWELFLFIIPRTAAALVIVGMIHVLLPEGLVGRWIGHGSGFRGILVGSLAGLVTPGGPIVMFPIVVSLYHSGAAVGPLVAYLTNWSLFGLQRILVWEYPLMGGRFVLIRVASGFLLPVIAGLAAQLLSRE